MTVSPMINTYQTYQGNMSTDGSGCIRLPPFPDFIEDFLSYRITPLQKKARQRHFKYRVFQILLHPFLPLKKAAKQQASMVRF